jgi:hypothetical protein
MFFVAGGRVGHQLDSDSRSYSNSGSNGIFRRDRRKRFTRRDCYWPKTSIV